jgi:hypothetical protein
MSVEAGGIIDLPNLLLVVKIGGRELTAIPRKGAGSTRKALHPGARR